MTEEQITNRYVRGWISLKEYRAEMVKLYDRQDAAEAAVIRTLETENDKAVRQDEEMSKFNRTRR